MIHCQCTRSNNQNHSSNNTSNNNNNNMNVRFFPATSAVGCFFLSSTFWGTTTATTTTGPSRPPYLLSFATSRTTPRFRSRMTTPTQPQQAFLDCPRHPSPAPSYNTYYSSAPSIISGPYHPFRWMPFLGSSRSSDDGIATREGSSSSSSLEDKKGDVIRIGIVGGGIAGVTVAHALATRYLHHSNKQQQQQQQQAVVQITVLEGDPPCRPNTEPRDHWNHNHNHNNTSRDRIWSAATARNANSLVPGAAMHVLAQPSVVWQVITDTVREWWWNQQQRQQKIWGQRGLLKNDSDDDSLLFQRAPPYFALHLWHCVLAPSIPYVERLTFVQFLQQFLRTCLYWNADDQQHHLNHNNNSSNSSTAHPDQFQRRGQYLHQLAAANRHAYLEAQSTWQASSHNHKNHGCGPSQGFVSLYRTHPAALAGQQEALDYGETDVEFLTPEQVVLEQHVPRLAFILAQSSAQQQEQEQKFWGVRRGNDHTASCELFLHRWIQEMTATGMVEYRPNARVQRLERHDLDAVVGIPTSRHLPKSQATNDDDAATATNSANSKSVYRVWWTSSSSDDPDTDDNTSTQQHQRDFDVLVLAAGPPTPLLAAQLGALKYCPTYPLRGFSLNVFVHTKEQDDGDNHILKTSNASSKKQQEATIQPLLLPQPFSLDSMYCSSVTPHMARMAGFGEFVGYSHHTSSHTIESVGPAVLVRYAQKLFPDAQPIAKTDVLPCYRCLSPDDLPLVGNILPEQPNLFLHTGHGTLGWTCGLATGDCCAQAIAERVVALEQKTKGSPHPSPTTATATTFFTLSDGTTIDRRILSPCRFVKRAEWRAIPSYYIRRWWA